MQLRLLDLLACPSCRADQPLDLTVVHQERSEIVEGNLRCTACEGVYPISAGIPRFVTEDLGDERAAQVKAHFTLEFDALAEKDRDLDPPEMLEYFFFSRAGLDPVLYKRLPGDPYRTALPENSYRPDTGFLKGKLVLDGGCGPGRFSKVAALSGSAYVVGLDIGSQVDRAKQRCSDLDNVDFIQGSVLAPPLRADSFDYAFSIGVLHHTPDPKGGVLNLAQLVKRGGAMSVWVYPDAYWGGRIRGAVGRAVHRLVSSMSTEASLRFCTKWLYPLGRVQMLLSRNRVLKILAAPLFVVSVPRHPRREVMLSTIYDYFGPSIISTHSYAEVRSWLSEAGFTDLYEVPVPSACLGRLKGGGRALSPAR